MLSEIDTACSHLRVQSKWSDAQRQSSECWGVGWGLSEGRGCGEGNRKALVKEKFRLCKMSEFRELGMDYRTWYL